MSAAKIAISIDPKDLHEVDRLVRSGTFPSRSRLIQDAVHEKLIRLGRTRLARESAKLDPTMERALADERYGSELKWPEY